MHARPNCFIYTFITANLTQTTPRALQNDQTTLTLIRHDETFGEVI